MVYNTTFDICAIIIYLFTLYYVATKKNTHSNQNRIFFLIIINGIVCSLADWGNATLLNHIAANPDMQPELWMRFILFSTMYIYLVGHNTLPPLFFMYTIHLIGKEKDEMWSKLRLIAIPYIISITLIALNPFMHNIFYFDEALAYHRGPVIYSIYLIGIFYVIASMNFIIHYRADIAKNRMLVLALFVFTCLVGALVQLLVPNLLIELFIQAVALLCILFTIENDGDIFNGITKIYNRRSFLSDASSMFSSHDRSFVTVVKITNLRSYQSVLGITFINEMLRKIASTLITVCDTSRVYDCENGNFAVLYSEKERNKFDCAESAIAKIFEDGWSHNNITLQLKAILYSVTLPENIENVETLVSLVDTETDSVRVTGKCTIVRGKETSFLQREQKIEKAIRRALDTRSLKVFYQPIWDSAHNKIHSAEALVRLYDEELGFIPPDEFIPIAERNNSISEIGEFVFEETVKLFGQKHIQQYGIRFIEVNMSPVQFMHKNLAETFRLIMEKYEVNAPSINLEITESAAINDSETFLKTMDELRNMGFTFSLDDYGTGYSNASHIFNLDFDIIKLDKSILWKADQKASAKIILRNTIQMIKEMNLKIVMEGVETDNQKQTVYNLGCDYIQGFYFSKPMEADAFIDYCKKFNKL